MGCAPRALEVGLRTVWWVAALLSVAGLTGCSDQGDDEASGGAGKSGQTAGDAASGGNGSGGRAGTGGAGTAARGGSGAADAGGGDGGSGGDQNSVGTPDADGGQIMTGTIGRPAYPSGSLAQTTAGCMIAKNDSLKCWMASPLLSADEFITLPVPGPYDAVYIEQSQNGIPFRCAHLQAGGYACYPLNSWQAPAAGREYAQLALGSQQSCGLLASGVVECWDDAGPTVGPAGTFIQIDAQADVSCGLHADGSGECWGGASSYNVFPANERLQQFSAGIPMTCGLNLDSHVVCWGVVGDAVVPTDRAQQVEVGTDYACALMQDGHVECFSEQDASQFAAAFELPPADRRFRELNGSYKTVCGITVENEVWCWGQNQPFTQIVDSMGQPIIARSR
jgi:hypothetical protein